MRSVNIHEAKTHLSKLVEDAARGNAFIIAKAGHPMVKVIPFVQEDQREACRIGFMKGEISVPEDFDRMGEDQIQTLFGAGEP